MFAYGHYKVSVYCIKVSEYKMLLPPQYYVENKICVF